MAADETQFGALIAPIWKGEDSDYGPWIDVWIGIVWPLDQEGGPLGEAWSGIVKGESSEEVEVKLSDWIRKKREADAREREERKAHGYKVTRRIWRVP